MRALNETAPRWERLRTRSCTHGVNNSRPSPAGARPGSTPPWNRGDPPCSFPPWPRRAAGSDRFWLLELRVFQTFLDNLRPICSGHGYPAQRAATTSCPRLGRFWLLELRVSRTFLDQLRPQLLRPWIPNSARHRRWTPMIQRGRARRTISAGSWFGQWSPDPPVLCDRSSPSPRPLARHVETSAQPNGGSRRPSPNESPTVGASPGNLRLAERRGRETPRRSQRGRRPAFAWKRATGTAAFPPRARTAQSKSIGARQ